MEHSLAPPGTPGVCETILEQVRVFDVKAGKIRGTPSGREGQFQFGRVVESLVHSGLSFYDTLQLLGSLEPKLLVAAETRDISKAIIDELRQRHPGTAEAFRLRYDEGVEIVYDGETRRPLSMSDVRDVARGAFASTGYTWGSRKSLEELAKSLLIRCQRLGMPAIPLSMLREFAEREYCGRLHIGSLREYGLEMPYATSAALAELERQLVPEGQAASFECIRDIVARPCRAILFHFQTLPSWDNAEAIAEAITLLERGREPSHPLHRLVTSFLTSQAASDDLVRAFMRKKAPATFMIEHAKAALRRVSFRRVPSHEQQHPAASPSGLALQPETANALRLLARFSRFIWPEDQLAASTVERQREHVLRLLFRYRCLSFATLTRFLQVHPKHTSRAVAPLIRNALVLSQRLTDEELLLITKLGEDHCAQHLHLRLRHAL